MADKFYGIFKVAAVDCLENEELCEDEFGVHDVNSVLAFSASADSDPVKYKNSEFSVKNLANFAVSYMESFVEYVTFSNYEDFTKK